MAKYDVYSAPDDPGYLLDIQCDLLEGLNTRVVIPLMPIKVAPKPAERLNPVFTISQKKYVMVTQFLSSVPVGILGSPSDNIEHHHNEILSAVDMLMQGF